jgi:hypothetical protein
MMPNYRTLLLVPAPKRPAGALSIDRVPTAVLGFAVVCSLLLSALTADRLARVERDYQPAVEETRQLEAALEATRVLLADHRLGALEPRIARADSQAQRFHNIASAYRAGTEPRAQMQGYDATFAEYYVAARRAAAGLSMSAEADGSSAEDAALGHEQLRENLALGRDLHEQAIDAARLSTAPAELAAWLTLGLLAGAVLLRRSNLVADCAVARCAGTARPPAPGGVGRRREGREAQQRAADRSRPHLERADALDRAGRSAARGDGRVRGRPLCR